MRKSFLSEDSLLEMGNPMKQAVLLITRGQLASSIKFVYFKMVCYKYSSCLLTSLICVKGFATSLFGTIRNWWEIKVL